MYKKISVVLIFMLALQLVSPILSYGSTFENSLFNVEDFSDLSSLLIPNSVSESVYPDSGNNIKKRYIINYKSQNSKERYQDSKAKNKTLNIKKGNMQYKHFAMEVAELTDSELIELSNNPEISSIELDHIASVQVSTYEDIAEKTTLAYDMLGGKELLSQSYLGGGIKVGVIDSGVDVNHPDLQIAGGASFIGDDFIDDHGHGTQVIGVIGAKVNDIGVRGLAPNSEVYALKAFDSTGSGYYSDIIEAIDWAIENELNILNMSFSGTVNSQALQDAINTAWQSGILIISSAGNNGNNAIEFPARYPAAIAVGSIEADFTRSVFSNYGEHLELVAPGNNIYTTNIGSSYTNVSGTSLSAAFVTAAAAEVWSANPNWTAMQVRTALLNSSNYIGDIDEFGYGLVQPLNAIHQQYVREVTVNPDGIITGAEDGDFPVNLAYTNRTPSGGTSPIPALQYVMNQGQHTRFSVKTEDAILDYFVGVFNPSGTKIADVHRNQPLPTNSLLYYDWYTHTSLPTGNYIIKIQPCFYESSGVRGCPERSAINWYVKLQMPGNIDTSDPTVNPNITPGPYYVGDQYVIDPQATDNTGISGSSITIRYGTTSSMQSSIGIENLKNLEKYTWSPQNAGWYSFIVTATDTSNNVSDEVIIGPYQVHPENNVPTVNLSIDPNAPKIVGRDIPIIYTANDESGIANKELRVYRAVKPDVDGGYEFSELLVVNSTTNTFRLANPGWHRISLIATDNNGNKNPEFTSPNSYVDFYVAQPTAVFVPGMMASVLVDSNNRQVWPPSTDLIDYLSEDEISRVGNALLMKIDGSPAQILTPVSVDKSDKYSPHQKKFIEYLQNNGVRVVEAPYDWRLDLGSEAVQQKIEDAVNEALMMTHGEPVTIITHSMGALPVRKFLIDNKNNPKIKVEALVNIAPPTLGTTVAMKAIEVGEDLNMLSIPQQLKPVVNRILRFVENKMVSVYQLLPSLKYINQYSDLTDGSGNPVFGDSFFDYEQRIVSANPFLADQRKSIVKNYLETENYLKGVNQIIYDKAKVFRNQIETQKINSKIKQYKFIAYGYTQPIKIFKTSHLSGISAPATTYKYMYGQGDNVVDYRSATYDLDASSSTIRYYDKTNHTNVLYDKDKYNTDFYKAYPDIVIRNEIAVNTNYTEVNRDELYTRGKAVTIKCPVNVGVYDDLGNFAGILEDGTFVNNIPNLSYDIMGESKLLFVPSGLNLHFEIEGYDTGKMDMEIDLYDEGVPVETNLLKDIQILDGTEVTFELNADALDNTLMDVHYDYYGDGNEEILHFSAPIPFNQLMGDMTAPETVLSVNNGNSDDWIAGEALISLNSTDQNGSGAANTFYQVDNGDWLVYLSPFQVTGDGIHQVSFYSVDYAGNRELARTLTIKSDVTPPSAPEIIVSREGWGASEVNFTLQGGDDAISGIRSSQYRIGDTGDWIDYSGQMLVTQEGITTIFARNVDNAGNISSVVSADIHIDVTAPTSPEIILSNTEWTNTDVTVVITSGTDNLSGIEKLQYKIGEEQWSDYSSNDPVVVGYEGEILVYARTIDRAGNASTVSSQIVKIDKTIPSSPILIPTTTEWANNTVYINITGGEDLLSGTQIIQYRLSEGSSWATYDSGWSIPLSREGLRTVSARSIDAAGNISEEVQITVKIDRTAPSSPIIVPSTTEWTNQDVDITLTDGVDLLSGIHRTEYRIGQEGTWIPYVTGETITVSDEGVITLFARSIDVAGNISNESTVELKIDKTVPTDPEVVSSQRGLNYVTLNWTESSDNNNVIGYEIYNNGQIVTTVGHDIRTFKLENLAPGTNYLITVKAKDIAGNVSLSEVPFSVETYMLLANGAGQHSLALRNSGTLWAWGLNDRGQLGDGTLINKNKPTETLLSNVKTMASGYDYSLLVKEDGTVWFAGASLAPSVVRVEGLSDISEVTAGGYAPYAAIREMSALDNSGNVWSKDTAGYDPTFNNFIQVSISNVQGITSGECHTAALKSDGTVWGWGCNGAGQIGNNAPKYNGYYRTEDGYTYFYWIRDYNRNNKATYQIPGLDSVVSISAGADHTLALKSDGTVWAWGYNHKGQLGTGFNTEPGSIQSVPDNFNYTPEQVALSGRIIAISAKKNSSLALAEDGTVWQWGESVNGDVQTNRPIKVNNLHSVVNIFAGTSHHLALLRDGSVVSWGANTAGQIGDGSYIDRENAVFVDFGKPETMIITPSGTNENPAKIFSPLPTIEWIHSNTNVEKFQVVVTDTNGQVIEDTGYMNQDLNQKGNRYRLSGNYEVNKNYQVSVRVRSGNQWSEWSSPRWFTIAMTEREKETMLFAGNYHNFELNSEWNIRGWGQNSFGQLGDGSNISKSSLTELFTVDGFISLSSGGEHTIGLKDSGVVFAWGKGSEGQLGNRDLINRNSPVRVYGLNDVIEISAGFEHNLALKADGTIWSWGNNNDYQLGNGTNIRKSYPVQVPDLTSMISIAAGKTFSAGLRNDGTVWVWGKINGLTHSTPVQVPNLSDIEAIDVGNQHGLALKSDGTVWSWGANGYGQLGIGSNIDQTNGIKLTGLNSVSMVSASGNHSLALDVYGNVWAWGMNNKGQLGIGSTDQQVIPIRLSLSDVIDISAGMEHSIAKKSDGTIWSWGGNDFGQLGNGKTTHEILPNSALVNRPARVTLSYPMGTHADPLIVRTETPLFKWNQTDDIFTVFTEFQVQILSEQGIVILDSGLIRQDTTDNNSSWLADGTLPVDQKIQVRVRVNDGYYWSDWSEPQWLQVRTTVETFVFAGKHYSFALSQEGVIRAWGDNEFGQLGDGSNNLKTTSVELNTNDKFIKVAAGSKHTIGLKEDGTVWSWGYNTDGQLGIGYTNLGTNIPTQTISLSDIIDISAGDNFSLALKSDGTVWSWGNGTNYKLGSGTTSRRTTPAKIESLNSVVAIASGHQFSIALKNDGTVWKWGYDLSTITTPIKVSDVNDIIAIAAGGNHALVLKYDGSVWGWGNNYNGQLGNGATTNQSNAVPVSGMSGVIKIEAGQAHSMALKSDGTVWEWGRNSVTTMKFLTPSLVSGLNNVSDIAAGYEHNLAVQNDGTLWAWGNNTYGQLGNGNTTSQVTPVMVKANQQPSVKVTYPVGSIHEPTNVFGNPFVGWLQSDDARTVFTDFQVRILDEAGNVIVDSGFISQNTSNYSKSWVISGDLPTNQILQVRVRVSDGSQWSVWSEPRWMKKSETLMGRPMTAAGVFHSMALNSEGRIQAWGRNNIGQLGDGSLTSKIVPIELNIEGKFSKIVAGYDHTLALRNDGTVWSWGRNNDGQLGDGTTHSRYSPVQITTLTNVVDIVAGYNHSIALRSDGTVWAWGDGTNYKLGNNSATRDEYYPVKVGSLDGVIGIAAGDTMSLALRNDGTVWKWGYDLTAIYGPTQVTNITNVIQISAGGRHALVLKNDGTVWGWGLNNNGQLGIGTTANQNEAVQVSGLSGVSAIVAGGYNGIALKDDGTIWEWGRNFVTSTNRLIPQPISEMANVINIDAGNSHNVVIKTDGTIWAWGINDYGQLGNGTLTNQSSPVLVQ